MALNQRQRWLVLGGILTLTLTAVVYLDEDTPGDDGVVADAGTARNADAQRNATAVQPESLNLGALRRQADEKKPGDAFASRSWYVPPPPPKALPPPPLAPPALPFTYMGRMVDEGKTTVFLTRQDRSYAVKEGEVLEGTYRIDRIDAGSVTLTYLPLNMQQTLAMGGLR